MGHRGNRMRRTNPTRENDDKLRDRLKHMQAKIRSLEKEVNCLTDANKQLEDVLAKNFEQISELIQHVKVEDMLLINRDKKLNRKNGPTTESRENIRKRFTGLIKNRSNDRNGGDNE